MVDDTVVCAPCGGLASPRAVIIGENHRPCSGSVQATASRPAGLHRVPAGDAFAGGRAVEVGYGEAAARPLSIM